MRLLRPVLLGALALSSSGCLWLARVSPPDMAAPGPVFSELAVSGDGRFVAFQAFDIEAGEGPLYVRDVATGTLERIDVATDGTPVDPSLRPSLSGDGQTAVFTSGGDVLVRDRLAGTTEVVSVDVGGGPADGTSAGGVVSADGRHVVFASVATDLVADDPTDGAWDLYVRDMEEGTTTLVAAGVGEVGRRYWDISGDGSLVVFESDRDDLVPGDGNGLADVFVHDVGAGTTERVSVDSEGGDADGPSAYPAISAEGGHVAFQSGASDLPGAVASQGGVYVRDLAAGSTALVGVGLFPDISADGGRVAFWTTAPLVAGDTNGEPDVYVHDLEEGHAARMSTGPLGEQLQTALVGWFPSISGDGRYVAFQAPGIEPGMPADDLHTYVRAVDRPTVTAVAPSPVPRGATTTVTVAGDHFAPGATVHVDGTGVTVGAVTVDSATQLTVELTVAADALVGGRMLLVAVPGHGGPALVGASVGGCACLTIG